ncbi:hypothetical protein BpHYR1_000602 [Brachionus plicatilis]|uniref:Uncharacterized protein n=1 Tax=Brachionus plicatilis TaxID=10195 RepID=A0A3M7R6Q6_BRAPC|nr:hypothetical protein BpHYR1_000602 [Brachionus plicatilis]
MNSTPEEKNEAVEFAEYLLRIGNGQELYHLDIDESNNNIKIPDDLIVKSTDKEFVERLFFSDFDVPTFSISNCYTFLPALLNFVGRRFSFSYCTI